MKAWRIGALLFLLGVGLGWLLRGMMPAAFAQTDEKVRLLRSIDERLKEIAKNVKNLDYNLDRVRDWDALRVRPVK